jgi:hypothetical protein
VSWAPVALVAAVAVDIAVVVVTTIVVVVEVVDSESTEIFPSHVCQKLTCCVTICWVNCIYFHRSTFENSSSFCNNDLSREFNVNYRGAFLALEDVRTARYAYYYNFLTLIADSSVKNSFLVSSRYEDSRHWHYCVKLGSGASKT